MLSNPSKYGLGPFAKPKTPSPECVDVAVSQVQSKCRSYMFPDPRCLDLAVSQVQSKVGLTCLPDPSKRGSSMFVRLKVSGLDTGHVQSTWTRKSAKFKVT